MRILVVDDDEATAEALLQLLHLQGHEVECVREPERALALLGRDQAFDALLLDYWMPGLDGAEFLRRKTSQATAPIPVVLMTADHAVRCPQAAAILRKPFEFSELEATLRQVTQPREAAVAPPQPGGRPLGAGP